MLLCRPQGCVELIDEEELLIHDVVEVGGRGHRTGRTRGAAEGEGSGRGGRGKPLFGRGQ